MKEKKSIFSTTLEDLKKSFSNNSHKPFRAQQVFNWLYKQRAFDPDRMVNIPKDLRTFLKSKYSFDMPGIIGTSKADDGTVKFQIKLEDGCSVECVLMQASTAEDASRGVSLCISSQVGCALGCKFCATGTMGLTRNLTAGEIVTQIVVMLETLDYQPTTVSIIYMGMGEPFNNTPNVLDSLNIMGEKHGLEIPMKRITVSTVGIPSGIEALFALENPPRLALSLHAPSQEIRKGIVPSAVRYPLGDLMALCRSLPLKSREKITIEYVLLREVNDRYNHAAKLADLLQGMQVKVNLIPFNESPLVPYQEPLESDIDTFMNVLVQNGITATVRRSKGRSASAACGQLVLEKKGEA